MFMFATIVCEHWCVDSLLSTNTHSGDSQTFLSMTQYQNNFFFIFVTVITDT